MESTTFPTITQWLWRQSLMTAATRLPRSPVGAYLLLAPWGRESCQLPRRAPGQSDDGYSRSRPAQGFTGSDTTMTSTSLTSPTVTLVRARA